MAGIIVKEIRTVKGETKMRGEHDGDRRWKNVALSLFAIGFFCCDTARVNAQQEEPV